jgi:integrase/recombinase XerD
MPAPELSLPSDWRGFLSLLDEAYSETTIRGYSCDFRLFEAWCKGRGDVALPASPELVADYVRAFTYENAPATIRRRISAIARIHRVCGTPDPTRSEIVRLSLRRLHRLRGQRQRQPLGLRARLRNRLLAVCGTDLRGLRNRAMVAVGYDTLCRRSELVALRIEDITALDDGAGSILVRRSKADPLGVGRLAYLTPETMEAIDDWIAATKLMEGPLLRSVRGPTVVPRPMAPYSVTRLLKQMAASAGLALETVNQLSGHSFRIGAALDMAEHGIDLLPIMHAGGWTAPEMVLRYTHQIDVTRSGAAQLYRKMKTETWDAGNSRQSGYRPAPWHAPTAT